MTHDSDAAPNTLDLRAREAWKALHLCSPRTLRELRRDLDAIPCCIDVGQPCARLEPESRCDPCFARYQVGQLLASLAGFTDAGDTQPIPTEKG